MRGSPVLPRPYYSDSERVVCPQQSAIARGPHYNVYGSGHRRIPRSANTLARVLMDQIQQPPIQISSHLHTPRSILLAIRHDIPRLVLIRNPDDAVSSLLQQQPGVTPATAFRVYAHFYHTLLPLADQVVVAHFPNILSDFAAIIERINSRFATDFRTSREGVTAHSDTTFDHIDTRMALFDGSVGVDSAIRLPLGGSAASV